MVTSSVTASFCALIAPTRRATGAVDTTADAAAESRIFAHADAATLAIALCSTTSGSSAFAKLHSLESATKTTTAATTTAMRAPHFLHCSPVIVAILARTGAGATQAANSRRRRRGPARHTGGVAGRGLVGPVVDYPSTSTVGAPGAFFCTDAMPFSAADFDS